MGDKYADKDLITLSGIQHIAFCERQWALIYIEQQWSENVLTVEGKLMHRRVDEPELYEKRKNILISRSVPLISFTLGLYGIADMIEFYSISYKEKETGVALKGRDGFWKVVPVEYKRGKKKSNKCDEVQLCAQAICMEEMLNTHISEGFIFYGQEKHRTKITFTSKLRQLVKNLASKMHNILETGETPKPIYLKRCKNCSLIEICMPKALSKNRDVKRYIKKNMSIKGGAED